VQPAERGDTEECNTVIGEVVKSGGIVVTLKKKCLRSLRRALENVRGGGPVGTGQNLGAPNHEPAA